MDKNKYQFMHSNKSYRDVLLSNISNISPMSTNKKYYDASMSEPKVDLLLRLIKDTLFHITTFLGFRDVLILRSICKKYYNMFSDDTFWKYIYEQNTTYDVSKKLFCISPEFFRRNYDKFKNVANLRRIKSLNKKIKRGVRNMDRVELISIESSSNMFDDVDKFHQSSKQIKTVCKKRINKLLDDLLEDKIEEYRKYVSCFSSNVGKLFDKKSKVEYIRLFSQQYDVYQIINPLIEKYWYSRRLDYIYEEHRDTTYEFIPWSIIKEDSKLSSSVNNEFYNNFIRDHAGCHIFVREHRYDSIDRKYDDIYVFNNQSHNIDILNIFFRNAFDFEIFENRSSTMIEVSKLKDILSKKYDSKDVTFEVIFNNNDGYGWL